MNEPRAHMRHVRALRYCAKGARAYFDRFDLDWAAFLRDGVPCSALEATGDAKLLELARCAREVG